MCSLAASGLVRTSSVATALPSMSAPQRSQRLTADTFCITFLFPQIPSRQSRQPISDSCPTFSHQKCRFISWRQRLQRGPSNLLYLADHPGRAGYVTAIAQRCSKRTDQRPSSSCTHLARQATWGRLPAGIAENGAGRLLGRRTNLPRMLRYRVSRSHSFSLISWTQSWHRRRDG